ncbi:hypothetical protein HYT91_03460, partial [Candidatus Pacearchaeota archaeon]|nr:hypothetical protein [Candidatus Pacearchaeota archaeon]
MKRGMIFGILITILLIGVVSALPNINIIYPANGTGYNDQVTQINLEITGDNLTNCWWNDGATNYNFNCNLDINGIPPSGENWNTWTIYANDTNSNVVDKKVTFWVDSISPILTVLNPLGNIGYTNTNILNLITQLTETNKGGYFGYSIEDGSNKYIARKFTAPNGNEFSGSYSLDPSNISDVSQTLSNPGDQEEGNYTFIIKARDKYPSGTTIRTEFTEGVIIRDTLPPITTISSPADSSLNSGIVNIISSAIDDLSVTTDVSGINNIDIQITDGFYLDTFSCPSETCNYGWDSTLAPDGIYNIIATSYDRAGNSDSIFITITTDNTAPTGTVTLGTPVIYDGDLVQEVIINYDEVMDISTT